MRAYYIYCDGRRYAVTAQSMAEAETYFMTRTNKQPYRIETAKQPEILNICLWED